MVTSQKAIDRWGVNGQRIAWGLLLLLVFVFGPWWLLMLLSVLGAFWFNFYLEGVFLLFLLESIFMVQVIFFPYILTVVLFLLIVLIENSKKFLIFYK